MNTPEELHASQLARESRAREEAERLLEEKSLELFLEMQERQRALDALRESEERYRLMVELSPDAILIESGGKVVFANAAAKKLFIDSQSAQLLGQPILDLAADEYRAQVAGRLSRAGQPTEPVQVEEIAKRLDGSRFEVSVRRVPLLYAGQLATQIIARDISYRKNLERELAYQATHDSLTGAINRSSLFDKLNDAISYADRHGFPVWVAFVDLDRFKQVNDRFGHAVGDKLLRVITDRLTNSLRRDDTLGRYGGDEFVLVLRGGPENHLTPGVIERLMDSVCEPVTVDGHELRVTCSIGIATYPIDGHSAETLMHHADARCTWPRNLGGTSVSSTTMNSMCSCSIVRPSNWNCPMRCSGKSFISFISRRSRSKPGASRAWKRCCDGLVPGSANLDQTNSSPWQSKHP